MLHEINQTEKDMYDTTYMWNLKKLNSKKQKVKWWLPGTGGGGGIGEMLFKGTNLQLVDK